jgi:hypothetical protein
MSARNSFLIFLLLLAVTGATFFINIRNQAANAEERRKRDADAYAIRNALVLYMKQNNGALPSSLIELKFERKGVDPSPFRLFDSGTRKSKFGPSVIAEAQQGGNGKYQIIIYADGTIRWE